MFMGKIGTVVRWVLVERLIDLLGTERRGMILVMNRAAPQSVRTVGLLTRYISQSAADFACKVWV
jgi:hypothetical protein